MSEFTFSSPNCGQHIQGDQFWISRGLNGPACACPQPLVVPSLAPPVPEVTLPSIAPSRTPQRIMSQGPSDVPCPANAAMPPATDFLGLKARNMSWQFRSDTKSSNTSPEEILGNCPIHNHALRSSGFVERGDFTAPRR